MSKFTTYDRAEELIFGTKPLYEDTSFNGLSLEKVKELIKEGYVDADKHINSAPSLSEMVAFADANPHLKFDFSGHTNNSGIRIDSMLIKRTGFLKKLSVQDERSVKEFGFFADDLCVTPKSAYLWWD